MLDFLPWLPEGQTEGAVRGGVPVRGGCCRWGKDYHPHRLAITPTISQATPASFLPRWGKKPLAWLSALGTPTPKGSLIRGSCRLSKNPRGVGGPQPSDCKSETSGVYGGFGTLAQQGVPIAVCRPGSRRLLGKRCKSRLKSRRRRVFRRTEAAPHNPIPIRAELPLPCLHNLPQNINRSDTTWK